MHGDFFVEFLGLRRGFTLSLAPQTKNPISRLSGRNYFLFEQGTNEQLSLILSNIYEESMNLSFYLRHLYVYRNARREREIGERFNHFRTRVEDVDDALVYAHLKLLACIFVDKR